MITHCSAIDQRDEGRQPSSLRSNGGDSLLESNIGGANTHYHEETEQGGGGRSFPLSRGERQVFLPHKQRGGEKNTHFPVMEGGEGRQPSAPLPEGDDEFIHPHLLTKEMPLMTEGKQGGDDHYPGAAVAGQYNLGTPAYEQDMPDLRERMAQRVEHEHHKLGEEELIYEKRQYHKRYPTTTAKTVKWKGKLTEFFSSEEAVPEDYGHGLPNNYNKTVQIKSTPSRDDLFSGKKEEPLTSMQEDFVTLGTYPDKYPVQKGGNLITLWLPGVAKKRVNT
jgi:hypothetical protein